MPAFAGMTEFHDMQSGHALVAALLFRTLLTGFHFRGAS